MSTRYIQLVDYLAIAAEITGLETTTLTRVAKIDLAESALHAPAAGFGETEFYPDFIEKARGPTRAPREEPSPAR